MNRIVVSTKNVEGTGSGFVTVCNFNTTDHNWAQVGDQISSRTTAGSNNRFGLSMTMSSDGNLIALSSTDYTNCVV